jgi:hypothetical protein
MRLDLALHKPAKKMAASLELVRREALGLQSVLLFGALQHGACGNDFLRWTRRGCFHADDDRMFRVDKIIDSVARMLWKLSTSSSERSKCFAGTWSSMRKS